MEKSKEYGKRIRIYKWDVRTPQIEHNEGVIVWIKEVPHEETYHKYNYKNQLCGNEPLPDILWSKFKLANLPGVQGPVADYISSKYCIDIDALSKPDSPRLVIMYKGNDGVCKRFVDGYLVELAMSVLCENFNLDEDDGLRLVEVPSLEKIKLHDVGGNVGSGGDRCAICLEEFSSEKGKDCVMGLRKTSCSHVFHGRCIDQWIWKGQSCPLCRFPLVEDLEYSD